MKKETFINYLVVTPIIICITLGLYEIFRDISISDDSKTKQIEYKEDNIESSQPIQRNEDYYITKDYQTFSDYQFAVKCPAILKDVSMQSNDDFDFNYAGSTDETFYQIMIVRIPAGRLDLTREEEKEFLIKMFAARGGGKSVLWGDDNYPAYLFDDYTQEGYKGRGIAVAREGYIYAFNVITKSDLDATFNSFTNSVKFL